MPEYLSPGVYVEETSSRVKPIEAASTCNAGFAGVVKKGPVGQALRIISWQEFEHVYGGLYPPYHLGYAVKQFFDEGGGVAYVSAVSSKGDKALSPVTVDDYIGSQATASGLYAFDDIKDINIITVPLESAFKVSDVKQITKAGLDYCSARKDCFFIADMPWQLENDIPAMLDYRKPFDTDYGAVYTPWLKIHDPLNEEIKNVPPSGAVAGKYACTDIKRGVHKAPAGFNSAVLSTVKDIKTDFTNGQQDILNPESINVIRKFNNGGIVIWGSRTLSRDPEWRYIPVRRTIIMIEESIKKGMNWAMFEPNNKQLRAKIRQLICVFLENIWRQGVFAGKTPDEAFFVKCDDETNPPSLIKDDQVSIFIGIAPLKPAEFIIIRLVLQCKDAGQ